MYFFVMFSVYFYNINGNPNPHKNDATSIPSPNSPPKIASEKPNEISLSLNSSNVLIGFCFNCFDTMLI